MQNDILAIKEKIEGVRIVVRKVLIPIIEGKTERIRPKIKIGFDIAQ